MAYSDYGAFVWRNSERRTDKEDAPLFASDAEEQKREIRWLTAIHHGIMGDGAVRVLCHKYGLPEIWEMTDNGPQKVTYYDENAVDFRKYKPFSFEYKGYQFHFEDGGYDTPYYVSMTEPDGVKWECQYNYAYGAGFGED